MTRTQHNIVIGLVIAVLTPAAGVLAGAEGYWWALALIGAGYAAVLYLILFFGGFAHAASREQRFSVQPRTYAIAGAFAILLGPVAMTLITPDNAVSWGAGFIIAGACAPYFPGSSHSSGSRES